jgi:hypothetical protein
VPPRKPAAPAARSPPPAQLGPQAIPAGPAIRRADHPPHPDHRVRRRRRLASRRSQSSAPTTTAPLPACCPQSVHRPLSLTPAESKVAISGQDANGGVDQRHRQRRARALAQAHLQIQQRPQAQGIQHPRVSGLGRTMAPDQETRPRSPAPGGGQRGVLAMKPSHTTGTRAAAAPSTTRTDRRSRSLPPWPSRRRGRTARGGSPPARAR